MAGTSCCQIALQHQSVPWSRAAGTEQEGAEGGGRGWVVGGYRVRGRISDRGGVCQLVQLEQAGCPGPFVRGTDTHPHSTSQPRLVVGAVKLQSGVCVVVETSVVLPVPV